MSDQRIHFETSNVDAGDPGKLDFLHNYEQRKAELPARVQGFHVQPGVCPGCLFPYAKPGKWPHTGGVECKAGKMVTCAKCGGPMFVKSEDLGYYYDCGLQHPKGQCSKVVRDEYAALKRQVTEDAVREAAERVVRIPL